MIKNLVSVLLAFMIMVTTVYNGSANNATPLMGVPDIDILTGSISVSGSLGLANKSLSVLVLNPMGTIGEILTNPAVLQHQRTITTDQSGNFSYHFQLNLDGVNDTGDYTIYIGGANIVTPLSRTFYFASAIDRKQAITNIVSATVTGLSEQLSLGDNIKMVAIDNFAPFLGVDKSLLAARLYAPLHSMNIDPNTDNAAGRLQSIIKEYSMIEAYNQSKVEFCYDANGVFMYPEIVGLSSIDATMGLNIYDIYTNLISTVGQSTVRNAMLGKNYNKIEDLRKSFVQQVILKGMTNPLRNGFAHIAQILTAPNMAAADLSLPNPLTDAVAVSLASQQGGFDTILQLQTRLNELLTPKPVDAGTKSSGVEHKSSGGFSAPAVITPISTPAPTLPPKPVDVFNDITDVQWATDAITTLNNRGVISGIGDGKFAPNEFVTREQFAKMICVALNISGSDENIFADVAADSWYKPYVSAARKAGIISGIEDNLFGTGEPITRQDISTMVYRTLVSPTANDVAKDFSDSQNIASYATEAVKTLTSVGLINGFEDSTFRPLEKCTRAQAAKIIYGLLKIKGGLSQ